MKIVYPAILTPFEEKEGYTIVVPDSDTQKSMVQFVKQTDKSKLAVQKELEKLELLKKSLMQQYFG